jgi:hypothetical protein
MTTQKAAPSNFMLPAAMKTALTIAAMRKSVELGRTVGVADVLRGLILTHLMDHTMPVSSIPVAGVKVNGGSYALYH